VPPAAPEPIAKKLKLLIEPLPVINVVGTVVVLVQTKTSLTPVPACNALDLGVLNETDSLPDPVPVNEACVDPKFTNVRPDELVVIDLSVVGTAVITKPAEPVCVIDVNAV